MMENNINQKLLEVLNKISDSLELQLKELKKSNEAYMGFIERGIEQHEMNIESHKRHNIILDFNINCIKKENLERDLIEEISHD